uniref:bluetail domain-containing putative surface protein n=1 Tax=Castellaniella sp. TaxID=1955812 RepID=UPI002AFE34BE
NIDLTGLTLAGVEKLVLDGNGSVAASTGTVTLTTANAISLDSIILNNAGVNTITIAGAHGATNIHADASGSTGATTIDASAYNTTTGAQLFGGSGNDFIEGSARSDIINGGAGNDLIGGTAIAGTVGAVTAVAASTATDILTGGAGNDTFAIGFVNAFANMSKITDLDLGTNAATGRVDSLIFDQAFAGAATIVTLSTAQQAVVTGAADLAAATVAVLGVAGTAGNVAQFTYGSDTYLLVNGDGNATYDFAADAIINITGVVGTLDASDITLI